jgi:tetratricopeptide (TPR) repeat protein
VVAGATFAAFAPALWNDFVDFDDYGITSNPAYQGLGLAQLRWMFTTVATGHYMPITWLSLALDYAIWGLDPVGYHLTSILVHVGIALLFYRAWVSARNDILSSFFFVLTVLLYLEAHAAGRRRPWLLAASTAAYFAALTSKAIVVTLPLVLVLLDVYPLRRLAGRRPGRGVWLEKVPYAVLALGGAAIAYLPHRPVALSVDYPWSARVVVALHSLWFYPARTAVPAGLSPLYELPSRVDPLAPALLGGVLGALAISALVLGLSRRWPAGLAVWTYHGITVAPVSGLVFTGWLAADRYGYLSGLGFALLLGAGVGLLVDACARGRLRPWLAWAAGGMAGLSLVGLALLSWQQIQVWRGAESLWREAVRATPECFICQTNRGLWLMTHGAPLSGLRHLDRAAALRPDLEVAHLNAAAGLARLGMAREAVEAYQGALARFPGSVAARVLLGEALLAAGRAGEAIPHFREVVTRDPSGPRARLGLVRAHLALGDRDGARREYEALRALSPEAASHVAAELPPGP